MPDIRTSSLGSTPFGTSETRPANPSIGQTYYNGTLGVQEIYTASGWLPATGANDFNVTLNGPVTTSTFTKEYFAGAYTIASALLDSSYDIYVYDTLGNLAGYTKSPSLNATGNFNKIVVVGGSTGDLLSFSYKTTFTATNTTSQVTAGAFITSVTPTALNSINDTTTLVGGNFASNVAVYFVGSDNVERAAKSIVRTSSSELIVTRPDAFATTLGTYKVVVENPGITRPTGSSLHILNNAITAGTTPNWTTATTLPEIAKGIAYTTTLVATDSEGTDIDYSILSGTLPVGTPTPVSFAVTNSGSGAYLIDGVSNGAVTLMRGGTYTFNVNASGHPFYIQTTGNGYVSGNVYSSGVTGAGAAVGTVTFVVPSNAPSTLYYQCQFHSAMYGQINIIDATPSISLNNETGVLSGTYTGADFDTTNLVLRAVDTGGNTVDRTFRLFSLNPVWNTAATLPGYLTNFAYSTTLSASDDNTITYSLQSGSLPTGIGLNASTGVLSGTSSSTSSFTFAVRATDSVGNFTDRTFTLSNAMFSLSSNLKIYVDAASLTGSGAWSDLSGNSNNFNLATGTRPSVVTKSGVQAMQYNNSGYWETSGVPNNISLNGSTISFWWYAHGTSSARVGFFEQRNSNGPSYTGALAITYEAAGHITYYRYNSTYQDYNAPSFQTDRWVHVTLVLTVGALSGANPQIKTYFDGVDQNVLNVATSTNTNLANLGALVLGSGYASNTPMQNGWLSAFRAWNIELTPSQVLADYNATKARYGR